MDFAIEFRTLAADSGWNHLALIDTFLHGLAAKIKDQLISLDIPDDLNGVIAWANKTDRRIHDRANLSMELKFLLSQSPSSVLSKTCPVNDNDTAEPMQLGRTRSGWSLKSLKRY